jgi:hypothetical protein
MPPTLAPHQIEGTARFYAEMTGRLRTINKQYLAEPAPNASEQARKEWVQKTHEMWALTGILDSWAVRSGKTLLALTIMLKWHEWVNTELRTAEGQLLHPNLLHALNKPFLIVSEAAGRHVWERELKTWYPEVDPAWIRTVEGGKDFAPAAAALQVGQARAISVSYTGIAKHWAEFNTVGGFSIGVFDECHNLANTSVAKSKAIHMLMGYWRGGAPGIAVRLGLSGTPQTNRVTMLWPMLATLNGYATHMQRKKDGSLYPTLRSPSWAWSTQEWFTATYTRPDPSSSYKRLGHYLMHAPDSRAQPTCLHHAEQDCPCLHNRLKKVAAMHRITTREAWPNAPVLATPEWVPVPMSADQRRIYEALIEYVVLPALKPKADGSEERVMLPIEFMTLFTYGFEALADLRQLEWSIQHKAGEDARLADLEGIPIPASSPKTDWLVEFVANQLGDDKLIVFTAYAHLAKFIADDPRFRDLNPLLLSGTGGLSSQEVERHFRNPEHRMVVATSKGYKALDLSPANIIVGLGFTAWNATELIQALGRIGGPRQTKERLLSFMLYAPDTLEDWWRLDKLATKLADAGAAIDNNAQAANELGLTRLRAGEIISAFYGKSKRSNT